MSIKSGILVILQILAMIYLVIANYAIADGWLVLLQILGAILGLWAILSMKLGNFNIQPEVKSDSLVKTGPYKWIRNPMYAAVLFFYFPIVIHHFSWINAFVFIVLLTILLFKIDSEEEFLEERFGEEYRDYSKSTKRLIPFIY